MIGLDGATWDLLKPWAKKGVLPTLRKLMEKGVHGSLESTIPPVTVPAWISFATGKNAGKHGCYYFAMPRNSLTDLRPITSREITSKTFYEMLEENGRKCVLINLPGSYPPRIKGPVLTSLLTKGDNFVFPPDAVDEIPKLRHYRITPDYGLLAKGIDDFVSSVRELERDRFECGKELYIRNWDFFFLLFSGTDMIQHQIYNKLFYGEMGEDSPAVGLYRDIDRYIGWFVDNAPEGTDILLMSDHGFRVHEKAFQLNQWLKRERYLETEPRMKPRVAHSRAMEAFDKASAKKINVKLPSFLLSRLVLLTWPSALYEILRRLKRWLRVEIRVDVLQPKMAESIAYSPYSGVIYINDKKRFIDGKIDGEQLEEFKVKLMTSLKKLKDPQTGRSIVNNIWGKEDIYAGPHLELAPDIVFLPDERLISNSLAVNKLFVDNKVQNAHSLTGFFLACGPSIKQGAEIQGATIYDLAPTILHMFDLFVPNDMDGRVLKEIFREASEPARREDKYQKVDEPNRVKEKIKHLRNSGRL